MAGDIVSIAGVAAAGIADTVAALEVDKALPPGKLAVTSLQCWSPWIRWDVLVSLGCTCI